MSRVFAFFAALLLFGGGVVLVEGPDIDADWNSLSLPWFNDDVEVVDDQADDVDDGIADNGNGNTGDDVDDCVPREAASEYLAEVGINWSDYDYTLGARNIDWNRLSSRNTDRAFSSPLRSEAALMNFLEGDSAASEAARRLIGDDFATVSGNWVAVQFNMPISYSGNYYWNGQRALEEGRQVAPAGDVWWLNVDSNCQVALPDIVRAACGNVGLDWIRPLVRPD